MTHFAAADDLMRAADEDQIQRFENARAAFANMDSPYVSPPCEFLPESLVNDGVGEHGAARRRALWTWRDTLAPPTGGNFQPVMAFTPASSCFKWVAQGETSVWLHV